MYESFMTRDAVWTPLAELRREVDRLLHDRPGASRSTPAWEPACDVDETEDGFLLSFEMPGVPKDQIHIEAVGNRLTLSGERKLDYDPRNQAVRYSERRYGKFHRALVLPAGVDAARVEASYEDGILRVVVPKAESAKPRQIKIASGSGGSGFLGKFLGRTADEPHSGASSAQVAS